VLVFERVGQSMDNYVCDWIVATHRRAFGIISGESLARSADGVRAATQEGSSDSAQNVPVLDSARSG
jgi:hypothetical protein